MDMATLLIGYSAAAELDDNHNYVNNLPSLLRLFACIIVLFAIIFHLSFSLSLSLSLSLIFLSLSLSPYLFHSFFFLKFYSIIFTN